MYYKKAIGWVWRVCGEDGDGDGMVKWGMDKNSRGRWGEAGEKVIWWGGGGSYIGKRKPRRV
jgi:hypothetical protein